MMIMQLVLEILFFHRIKCQVTLVAFAKDNALQVAFIYLNPR